MKKQFYFTLVVLFTNFFTNVALSQTLVQYYGGMNNLYEISIWQNINQNNLINVRAAYQDFGEDNISLSLGYGHSFGQFLPFIVYHKDITSDLNNFSIDNGYYWSTGKHLDFVFHWQMVEHEKIQNTSDVSHEVIKDWSQTYAVDVYYNLLKYKAQIGIENGITSSKQWYWGIMLTKKFHTKNHH